MFPRLESGDLFACTENCTTPLPMPLDPAVMLIQVSASEARPRAPGLRRHRDAPRSALAGSEMLVGVTSNAQIV